MEELEKLYGVLIREGKYTKSFDDFKVQFSDPKYQDKVFEVVSRDKLYTKDKNSFLEKYATPLKKKDLSQPGSSSGFAPSQDIKPGTSPFIKPYTTEVPKPMAEELQYKKGKDNAYASFSGGGIPGTEKMADYTKQLGSALEKGANEFNKGLASVPLAAYDFAGYPFRKIGLSVPTSSKLTEEGNKVFGAINTYIANQSQNQEQLMKDAQIDPEVQKGIVENVKNGNYTNAFKSAGLGIAESLPAMIGMALTGGMTGSATKAATIGGMLKNEAVKQTAMAAPFIANRWKEIADDPTMSEEAKILNAIGVGYAETWYEDKFGSLALLKQAKKILAESGEQAARDFIKKGFVETMKSGFSKYFPLTAPITNAIEEGATKWTQNATDILTGKNPNLDPLDGVSEAMAQGGAFGLAIGATTSVAKYAKSKKLQRAVAASQNPQVAVAVREKLDEQLQNEEITPEEHDEAIATIESAQAIDATIPQDLTGEARIEANELVSMRNDIDEETSRISEEMNATDPAFQESYKEKMIVKEGEKQVLNDAIVGLTKPVIYRQTKEGFVREKNGVEEPITEAQFNFAKDNQFTGIKVEEITSETPAQKEEINIEEIDNRLADIETELQDPDITEERIQELNIEKEKLNATKESSQQITQGGEQGNQLQREGAEEGQSQVGEGEGSIGQTTQPETDSGDSDNKGQGQEVVSGPPSLLPPSISLPSIGTPNTPTTPNQPGGPTPPNTGVGPQNQPSTSARSVERTRRELLDNLPKKKKGFSEWVANFFEHTTDDKYRVASFLRDSGGKLVEAYMRLRQGASGAAKAFSEQTKKAIFGDLSFKKNINYLDTEGNPLKASERELLDGVITSRRILNIDEMLRKRYAEMMALRDKVINGTATFGEKAKYKQDVEYLRERKAITNGNIPQYVEQKGEDGLTVANHKAYLLNLEAQLPPELIQKLADKALKYNKYFKGLLTEQYNAGVFNKDQYDALMEQDYAPRAFWERMMEEDMPSLGQREFMSKLNQGIKKLAGGSQKLVYGDYEALMDMMSVAAFNRILENRAANELAIFANANPNNGVVKEAQYERTSSGAIKQDKFGNPIYKPLDSGRGSIIYYDKGVKKRLDVPADFETIWYDSRDYLSPEAAKNLRRFSLVNLIKKGATEWNIAFGLMQFATLDAPHVLMFTNNYNPILPIGIAEFGKDVMAVAKDLKNRTGVWKEASEAGAFSNLMSRDEDLTDPSKYLNKNQNSLLKAGGKFIQFSGDVNEYFETLTRLAVYNKKKNDLISAYKKANGAEPTKGSKEYQDIVAEAALAAKSTVDFGKSGRATKAANNAFAYLNAATQTFNTSVTYMKDHPVEFMSKISQMGAVAAGLALYSMGFFEKDEEEKKRKGKIYNEIPDYVKRNKFVYVPSKDEEPIFKALGLIDDKVKYIAPLPKPQVANFFLNAIEDASVSFYMPEQSQGDRETLDGIALDIANSLPFNPGNIASRNPLIAASRAASNYDDFRKKIIVQNEQITPDYQEGQDKKTVAPLYKAIGTLSKDIAGGEGISPAITQSVVEKVITNPEKNPLFSLFFQPISYAAVKATGDELLMKEFKERFDPTLGFVNRIKGSDARKKQENKEVSEIIDRKTYSYDALKSIQRQVFSGANDQQISNLIDRLTSKEVLAKLPNLNLSDEDIQKEKERFKIYAKQSKAIYQSDLPEWFSEIPKETSNEDKAKEILFNTTGMNNQQRDKIVRQLIENKFILPGAEKGSVKWHLKELQKK